MNQSILKYILLTLLSLVALSCQPEGRSMAPDICVDGEEVELCFTPTILRFDEANSLKASGPEPTVQSLTLLVFDASHANGEPTLLYIAPATNLSNGSFSVTLQHANAPRVIHAVANYPISSDAHHLIDKDEGEVIAQMQSATPCFWQRIELPSIDGTTSLQVQLLRNFAKVELQNDATTTFTNASIKLFNSPDIGTIAPFNPVSCSFTEGQITEAAGATYVASSSYDVTHYPFEAKNSSTRPIFAILKGEYQGAVNYYKIDLSQPSTDPARVGATDMLDLQRNYLYRITIKQIKRAGATTEEEAINAIAINSSAIDYSLDAFPAIYSVDGKRSLSVEQTVFNVGADTPHFNPRFSYKEDGVDKNSEVSIRILEEDPSSPLIRQIDKTYQSGGALVVYLHPLPTGAATREARIILEVDKQGEKMTRSIRVVQYAPFSLEPALINGLNPATINESGGAGQSAVLTFNIPDDYPKSLYPIPVEIATETMTPDGVTLPLTVKNGELTYTYTVTQPGQQTIRFKTNKADSQEAITLVAPNFLKTATGYNIGYFRGDITYNYNNAIQDLPYRQPDLISTSMGRVSMPNRTAGRYTISLPLSELETTATSTEPVTISAKILFTAGTGQSTIRVFSAKVPIEQYRQAYQANRDNPADVDVQLEHTSTLIHKVIGGKNATNDPLVLFPKGTEVEVTVNGQAIPAKVWEMGSLEIDLPIKYLNSTNDDMNIALTHTTVTPNSGLIYEEYQLTQKIFEVTRPTKLEMPRTKLQIFGSYQRGTGWILMNTIKFFTPPTYSDPGTNSLRDNNRYEVTLPKDLSDTAIIKYQGSDGMLIKGIMMETTVQKLRKDATITPLRR